MSDSGDLFIIYFHISRQRQQIRGFKTQRAVDAQLKRNPTFSSRLNLLFGKIEINDLSL